MQQVFLDSEKEVLERLKENYQDALDEINTKIEILLARQDADMQHVIYQVEYQKALKTQVKGILDTLQANEFETISEYLTVSYENGFIGTMYDMQAQGIPLIMPIDQEQVVKAIQHETKLSESLYNSLGKDIKVLNKQIAGEISRGISTGMMFSEISRNISGYARINQNNAMRIVRTEGHRIQCKATMDACYKAKSKGANVVKQWDASLDGKTRPSHRRVDGEIRELDEPFSNGLMYPGDSDGDASEVVNCRCALLQRAKWALGNDFTKWTEDDVVVEIKAKNYQEFKDEYFRQIDEQRVRSSIQKMKSQETLEKSSKSGTIKMNLQLFAEKDIKNQGSNSLKRAIRKYETKINEHEAKISNPENYIPKWEDKDIREQEGLIKHWKKEIRNFNQSINDRVDELKARGDYDE